MSQFLQDIVDESMALLEKERQSFTDMFLDAFCQKVEQGSENLRELTGLLIDGAFFTGADAGSFIQSEERLNNALTDKIRALEVRS